MAFFFNASAKAYGQGARCVFAELTRKLSGGTCSVRRELISGKASRVHSNGHFFRQLSREEQRDRVGEKSTRAHNAVVDSRNPLIRAIYRISVHVDTLTQRKDI